MDDRSRVDPSNPYAPPAGQEESWSPPQNAPEPVQSLPTSAPKVFGVLSIIFASIVLLLGLMQSCTGVISQSFSSFGQMVPEGTKNATQAKAALDMIGTFYFGVALQGLILTVMSALLLAVGIGQVRYRRWAGKWSVLWSYLAFVALAGMIAIAFLVMGPAWDRFMTTLAETAPSGKIPPGLGSSISSVFSGATGLVTVFFYAPYPILLLIFFSKRHVREAMNN